MCIRDSFGSSSEKTKASQPVEETVPEAEPTTNVKEHKRVRKKKSVRADLYEALPVVEVPCDIPEEERICPDCDSKMEHLGYKFVREAVSYTHLVCSFFKLLHIISKRIGPVTIF